MRILHIGKFFPPEWGGMETFLYALSHEQAEHGHDVNVLVCKKKDAIQDINTHNLKVIRHSIQKYIGGYAPFSLGLLISTIKHCYGKNPPHIIHVHAPNIAVLWVAMFCFQPIILHWHSDVIFPDEQKNNSFLMLCWRIIEKLILYRAKKIIVTSQNYLKSNIFLQNVLHKCTVISLALPKKENEQKSLKLEHSAVNFLKDKSQALNILAVGRLTHYKGFPILLNALRYVPKTKLCLIGTGELQKELENFIYKHNLQERVFMADELDDDTLQACYQNCDAFILPSILRTEAFGMVLLEAMQFGKACIVTDVLGSGMNEVVQNDVTGLIVQHNSSEHLAKAIKYLINNPQKCYEMGRNGKLKLEQNYNISAVKSMIDEVYNSVT